MLPKSIPKTEYHLQFTEGNNDNKSDWINVKFTLHDVICFVLCATVGSLYLYNKVFINFKCSRTIIMYFTFVNFFTLALDCK